MQLAREVGALLLARRLDAGGELPQLFLRLAQSLLLVGDVGAGADVADQFAARSEARRAMANHPAVLTVGASQPVLERVRCPALRRPLRMARKQVAIVTVDAAPPPAPQLVFERSPGEREPLAIEEITTTVRTGHPQHHRRIVGDGAKESVSVECCYLPHVHWFGTRDREECLRHGTRVGRNPTECHVWFAKKRWLSDTNGHTCDPELLKH